MLLHFLLVDFHSFLSPSHSHTLLEVLTASLPNYFYELWTSLETGWFLGPWILYCSARTWTNASLSDKIHRNYKGLKLKTYMSSWGKLWTIIYIKAKTQLPLLRCQEQGTARDTCIQYHQGVDRPLKSPLPLNPLELPLPSLHNQLAFPSKNKWGHHCLFLLPHAVGESQ